MVEHGVARERRAEKEPGFEDRLTPSPKEALGALGAEGGVRR